MIETKKDLIFYLNKDREALGIPVNKSWKQKIKKILIKYLIWNFQRALRYHEYYLNRYKKNRYNLWIIFRLMYWRSRHNRLGLRLGFTVPCNVFGYGLRINHYGLLVVNSGARIGNFCDIHQGVNIGQNIKKEVLQR